MRASASCCFSSVLLLVLFCSLGLPADQGGVNIPQYIPRVWQVENGLPQNIVQAIVQTHDGYLWIGTQKGLARFDGVNFTIFDQQTSPEMTGQFITALCETRDRNLWIGTTDGGLMRYNGREFIAYGLQHGLTTNYVKRLIETRDGVLWVGTVSGLSRYRNGRFETYPPSGEWVFNAVRAMFEDGDGTLWVGTDTALLKVNDDTFSVCEEPARSVGVHAIRAMWQDRQGTLWWGTLALGLLGLQKDRVVARTTDDGLVDNMVTAIFEDRKQNLWVGTYAGLCRLSGDRFVAELDQDKMPFNTVNAFCEDAEGNLWVGTKDGLHQLKARTFTTYTESDGLARNNVIAMTESRDGSIWIGTWGGGLNVLKDGKISAVAPEKMFAARLGSLVLSLAESHDGSLWIGTDYGGGLFHYQDGKFSRHAEAQGLVDRTIRALHEDRTGNLWLGTSTALNRLKDGKFTRYTTDDKLPANTIRVVFEDRDGILWIGTSAGLCRFENGSFKNFSVAGGFPQVAVVAVYQDREGVLWFGTTGAGLHRLKDGRFTSYTTTDGLFNDDVFGIVEDDGGDLWMSCRYGVFSAERGQFDDFDRGTIKHLRTVSYGRHDGLVSTECNSVGGPSIIKTKDGRIWFGTAKGLAVVNPSADVQANAVVPPVAIERVVVDHTFTLMRSQWQTNVTEPLITIGPTRGQLQIQYTCLSLTHPEQNQFRFRLEGVDTSWVNAGTRRAAYYNLRPGIYRFRVIACNNQGVWNTKGDVLTIRLRPYFWQTWWFAASIVACAGASVFGTARYVTNQKLRRHLRRLEHEHALDSERARIAKDMHDHLGASITRLGLLSELICRDAQKPDFLKVHTSKMADTSRDLANTLDEIVWSVNPANDTLKRLATYIVHYAEEFCETASIRCRLEVATDLPECSVAADVRHNLFSAVKEAINNVAKHSRASEVMVAMQINGSELEISIEDNGCGFIVATVDPSRNGLRNLERRLVDVSGKCRIWSQPGQGTKVKFSIALSRLSRKTGVRA